MQRVYIISWLGHKCTLCELNRATWKQYIIKMSLTSLSLAAGAGSLPARALMQRVQMNKSSSTESERPYSSIYVERARASSAFKRMHLHNQRRCRKCIYSYAFARCAFYCAIGRVARRGAASLAPHVKQPLLSLSSNLPRSGVCVYLSGCISLSFCAMTP
jgi:hypothetical protein